MINGFDQKIYDENYDVASKISYFKEVAKPDGYHEEPLRIIFAERIGEEFEPGWQQTLTSSLEFRS